MGKYGKEEYQSFASYRNEDHQIGCCQRLCSALLVSVMIVIVLYTIVLIKRKQASYFSCVVFLSIVVNHAGSFLLYECDY